MVFIVMQPPSSGQQSPSVGSAKEIFPVHEHFSNDTPEVPKSIIVSMMTEKNRFVARFILAAKLINFQNIAVKMCIILIKHAAGGGSFERLAVDGLVARMAFGALQHAAIPTFHGLQAHLVTMGAGAVESDKLAIADAAHEDTLVTPVDSHRAPYILQGGEVGLRDIYQTPFAERRVTDVVAGAGRYE